MQFVTNPNIINHPLEKVAELYEKLLKEKENRIEQLEILLNINK